MKCKRFSDKQARVVPLCPQCQWQFRVGFIPWSVNHGKIGEMITKSITSGHTDEVEKR